MVFYSLKSMTMVKTILGFVCILHGGNLVRILFISSNWFEIFKLNFGTLIKGLQGLKNCVHARVHVRIMYAKALERNL